jgi:predicted Zn-dependent protease
MKTRLSFTLLLGLLVLAPSCSWFDRRKIYFVPIGDFSPQLTSELVTHYKNKFNLTIEVLPAIALDRGVIDSERKQLIAEESIEMMKRKYSNLATDPNAILIGFTQEDMYIRKYTWRFAFTWRQEDRFAVVSIARMDPINLGQPANDDLLRTRLRKITTKNIGILYYRKPQNDNPGSVLYSQVGGIEELDNMGEDF